MNSKRLTRKQALLLQRFVDGEATGAERKRAESLLEDSACARVYVSALEELGHAIRAAEEQAWQRVSAPAAEEWVRLATASADLTEASLDDLAPLLERFHDGEADTTEAAVVAALIDERDDVAEYLAELDGISSAVRQSVELENVDFDGFWEGVAAGIEEANHPAPTVPLKPFDSDEHRLLLYRYHDGEVSEEERRCVEAWIAAGETEVEATLAALAEVHLGVTSGVELVTEGADLGPIWTGIQDHLQAADAERAADNVVSLERRAEDSPSRGRGFWNNPMLAAAAAVVLLITGALIGPRLIQPQDEVQTRTVVIVDNVETAPGSTFRITSPQLAGHEIDSSQPGFHVSDDDLEPTILWLIDDEDDDDDDDDDGEFPDPI